MECPSCGTLNDILATKCVRCGTDTRPVPTFNPLVGTAPLTQPISTPTTFLKDPPAPPRSHTLLVIMVLVIIGATGSGFYWFKFKRISSAEVFSIDTTVPSSWQTFSSTKAEPNYSVRYPADWTSKEVRRLGLFTSQDNTGNISITFQPNQSGFSQFYSAAQSATSQNLIQEKLISHRTYSINGLQAEQAEVQFASTGTSSLYEVNTDILSGSSLYSINMNVDSSDKNLAADKSVYAKLTSSFLISQ